MGLVCVGIPSPIVINLQQGLFRLTSSVCSWNVFHKLIPWFPCRINSFWRRFVLHVIKTFHIGKISCNGLRVLEQHSALKRKLPYWSIIAYNMPENTESQSPRRSARKPALKNFPGNCWEYLAQLHPLPSIQIDDCSRTQCGRLFRQREVMREYYLTCSSRCCFLVQWRSSFSF